MRVILLGVAAVVLLLLVVPTHANGLHIENRITIENDVIIEINRMRAQHGLRPVVWNPKLQQATIHHTADMVRVGWFSHTSSNGLRVQDRVRNSGYNWRFVGEVLGLNQDTPQEVVYWWMNSPPHKAALLKPQYTDVGVTFSIDHRGWYWWTVNFGQHK